MKSSGKKDLFTLCTEEGNTKLLSEWDYEKNGELTPRDISAGSHQKVWWKCENGHTWQSEVRVRVRGARCPYCSKRMMWVGGNDLATVNPALAAEWDYEKNGDLKPSEVIAGGQRYVWWKCSKGHSWRARIISRMCGSGCPVCDGKSVIPGENDLRTLYPKLAEEWNFGKNGDLTPDKVTAYSNKKVWWKCRLGHEWQAIIGSRASENSACPFCTGKRVLAGFNDLETVCPEVAKQWDQELNGRLTPAMVTPGSHKKVWWKCSEGHVWKAVVYSRTGNQQSGCPVCAGKVSKRHMGTAGDDAERFSVS